jgi:hypothetical protein
VSDVRSIFAILVALAVTACSASDRQVSTDPRGEFVSTKPDGTEWTFRTRGNSLWVAVVNETRSDELGTIELSGKESRTLWKLIELVDVGGRKKGKPDPEHGTVILRLRETDDGGHGLTSVQVSRHTEDQDVIDLANYLIDLVAKHKGVEAQF